MWFGLLKIRTKSPDASKAAELLMQILSGDELPPDLGRYRVFFSGAHANEAMLTLCWNSPGPKAGGSDLGNRLAYSLKPFGLVELSMWSDETDPD